jgi:hypothetical protein
MRLGTNFWKINKSYVIITSIRHSTWMTPPPGPSEQFRNSLGSCISFPSQSIMATSSSVHAGLVICERIWYLCTNIGAVKVPKEILKRKGKAHSKNLTSKCTDRQKGPLLYSGAERDNMSIHANWCYYLENLFRQGDYNDTDSSINFAVIFCSC